MLNLKAPVAIATLLLAGAASAATSNGIANGGFETVNGANQPAGWVGADSSPAVLSNDAHSGAHAMLLSAPGGFGGSGLLQHSVTHGGLAALTAANVGDTPVLSFWAKGDASPTGNAKYALSYLGEGDAILYDSGLQFFQSDLKSSEWKQISFTAAAIPAGTKAVYLLMNTAVGPLQDGRINAIYIDDVQLTLTTAVPEPESYALLIAGLAVVGAVARRRRA